MESLFASYNELLKTNPVAAGLLPVMMLGMASWFLRDLPLKIWSTIKNQSTTTLSLLSSGAGSADMQYFSFLEWFVGRGFMRWSRSLSVESAWTKDADGHVLPGNGTHYFIWRGRPCWLTKSRVDQGGTMYQITHQISVGMLGRNQNLLKEMVDEFRWKPSGNRGHLFSADYANGTWSTNNKISPRKLETIVLNEGVMENLVAKLQWYFDNREWYVKRGLAWRIVILLEGPPGTGKTSLLRALTTHFKRNLCPLNLELASEARLPTLLRSAPEDSFIVIEDFDSCQAVLKAEHKSGDPATSLMQEYMGRSGKTAILQALDGVDVLDGQVIFLTTNYIDRIEPALIRDERVNHIIHLGLLENEAIHRYILNVFPEEHTGEPPLVFAPISGATLQKLYVANHLSYRDFISSLPVTNPDAAGVKPQETV